MSSRATLAHDWFPRPIPRNVVIGDRSWFYSSFAFLHYRSHAPCGLQIGSDTGVYNGTFFDLGPEAEVKIGNFCAIVGAIFSCNSRIVIGDYALIAHEVVLADSAVATPPIFSKGGPIPEPDEPAKMPSIAIGPNVWIGTRAVLLSGASIGEGAIIGAAAVVDFIVPPYSVVVGNPAKIVSTIRRG
jgi:acetyltransferase-like isoleucine patch superfamily enzyme